MNTDMFLVHVEIRFLSLVADLVQTLAWDV